MAKELEDVFKKMVPFAKDLNEDKFQSPVDFDVKGYKVDVKCSTKKDTYKNNPNKNKSLRWHFVVKFKKIVLTS